MHNEFVLSMLTTCSVCLYKFENFFSHLVTSKYHRIKALDRLTVAYSLEQCFGLLRCTCYDISISFTEGSLCSHSRNWFINKVHSLVMGIVEVIKCSLLVTGVLLSGNVY